MPLLPKDDLSYWTGRLVHQKLPEPLRVASMKAFAKAYNINLEEAEKPIQEYASIGDLFTRKLKAGVRPLGPGLVHPCDSKVAEAGRIKNSKIAQVKGIDYPVPALLQSDTMASKFMGGAFITYYLCPTDYHRVHAPIDFTVEWIGHIPGAFWPVNSWSVRNIDQLYSINERVALVGRTDEGESLALVMVAATNVGAISISFDERIKTDVRPSGREKTEHFYSGEQRSGEHRAPIHLKKGDEVGVFSMGSSVVMLMDKALTARLGLTDDSFGHLRERSVKLGQTVRKN